MTRTDPGGVLLGRLLTDTPLIEALSLLGMVGDSNTAVQAGEPSHVAEMRKRFRPQVQIRDGVAVVPVAGVLARRPSLLELAYFGYEDTDALTQVIEEAAGQARAMVLDVDSPGGFFTGGPELADTVGRIAQSMPVVAWTGGQMASLAYMIGAPATAIISTGSAQVGAIGAYQVHVDSSDALSRVGIRVEVLKNAAGRFKAIGVAGVALTDEQREYLQGSVEDAFSVFSGIVTRARLKVPGSAMEGQLFRGAKALEVGLVDAIGSLPYAVAQARHLAKL